MNFKDSILVLLMIFCVVLSATAVSAADNNDQYLDESHDGHDGAIIPPDNSHDEVKHAAGEDYYLDGSQDGHNGTIIPPDYAHNEEAMMNATNTTCNATGNTTCNATVHAAGENLHNTTGNTTNATSTHALLTTGNPILALLAVFAVIGGYSIIRRNK
ncbi:hypothetical protein [Methanobrevibacter sp.]|uniref:hypothetical protein n=1 Tax=Methanobrevibacter sp. TaxID=66852 RepID=UPI00388ED324